MSYYDRSHINLIVNSLLEIKAENIFFSTATQINRLKPVLDSEPPSIRKIKKFTTVISQPLQHTFKWNDKNKVVLDWPIHLDGFGHGKASSFPSLTVFLCFNSPASKFQTGTWCRLSVCTRDSTAGGVVFAPD